VDLDPDSSGTLKKISQRCGVARWKVAVRARMACQNTQWNTRKRDYGAVSWPQGADSLSNSSACCEDR